MQPSKHPCNQQSNLATNQTVKQASKQRASVVVLQGVRVTAARSVAAMATAMMESWKMEDAAVT